MRCLEGADLVRMPLLHAKYTDKCLEYAAAFFLLAGNLRDAVNICAQQMQDPQLAITIARVYDGDESPVLKELLKDRILPLAAFEGNRWMAMWAFWMLGRQDMAVRALIVIHSSRNYTTPGLIAF